MTRPSLSCHRFLRAFVVAFFAAVFVAQPAVAADYDFTDTWYNPAESGWGVNFTQSDNFIFATFFIYGSDKKPTWYTAQMTWDGASKFSGGLYATQGTYFALPWNPSDNPPATPVGTAVFTPSSSNNFQGTLTYTVNGAGTVTKTIQRQTLTSILLAGNYIGGTSGAYSGCSTSTSNGPYTDYVALKVTQSGNGVSMVFAYNNNGNALTCTLAGTLTQTGDRKSTRLNSSHRV